MFPSFTAHNHTDVRWPNSHESAYHDVGLTFHVQSPDLAHLGLSEFGATVSLATLTRLRMGVSPLPFSPRNALRMSPRTMPFPARIPAFSSSIPLVIQVCAGPQMRGVATGRVIAVVENIQAGGDGTFDQLVSHAVCTDRFFMSRIESAISIGLAGKPGPTFIWPALVNLRPEAFFRWFSGIDTFRHVVSPKKGDPLSLAVLVKGTRYGALGVRYENSANHIGSLDTHTIAGYEKDVN